MVDDIPADASDFGNEPETKYEENNYQANTPDRVREEE